MCVLTCEDDDHHVPAAGHGDAQARQHVLAHLPAVELAQVRQGLVHIHGAGRGESGRSAAWGPQVGCVDARRPGLRLTSEREVCGMARLHMDR